MEETDYTSLISPSELNLEPTLAELELDSPRDEYQDRQKQLAYLEQFQHIQSDSEEDTQSAFNPWVTYQEGLNRLDK